jgi:hypothetical protein
MKPWPSNIDRDVHDEIAALRNRLIGVHPFDPALWSLAAGTLVLVAVLASLKPARAATRVNVNETLRAL